MMGVGDRHGERVGGVGARDLHSGEEPLDHGVDLGLFSPAGADHRFLDQPRRIFADRDSEARGGEQDDAPSLAELQGGLRIVVDEHLLDRRAFGAMLGEDGEKLAVEGEQPVGKSGLRIGSNLAVGDMAEPVPVRPDEAPAGAAKPRIKAEDDQESFSITSSDTS